MNDLTSGDRVAVYCTPSGVSRRVLGTVVYRLGDTVRFEADGGDVFTAHRKQCRKLKPKKVKGTWAVVDVHGEYTNCDSRDDAEGRRLDFDLDYSSAAPHRTVFLKECKNDE